MAEIMVRYDDLQRYCEKRHCGSVPLEYIKQMPTIVAEQVNPWIPCSERLPVLYVPVMILTGDGSYAIAHVTENEDEYLWFGDGGHYSKDYVLFWMPLPKKPHPPKKEAEKDYGTD